MDKSDLMNEITELEKAYYDECTANRGHEGSTLSYRLRSQLEILIKLLAKYYGVEYTFHRY